jgi:hypothetical protein
MPSQQEKQAKIGDMYRRHVSSFFGALDMPENVSYNAAIMDSAIDRQSPAAALSSLLWNWWAVPTAR